MAVPKPLLHRALVGLLLALVPAPAWSQSSGLEDLVGARAGQAEAELQRRGYRDVRGEKGDDRSYTYWWNAQRRQCVTIATMDGRYDSITPTTPPDCGQSAGSRTRPERSDDRYGDRSADRRGFVAPAELSHVCRSAAADYFVRRPGDITANAPIRQPYGYIVQGWYADDGRTHFFNCRFDEDGRVLSVG